MMTEKKNKKREKNIYKIIVKKKFQTIELLDEYSTNGKRPPIQILGGGTSSIPPRDLRLWFYSTVFVWDISYSLIDIGPNV